MFDCAEVVAGRFMESVRRQQPNVACPLVAPWVAPYAIRSGVVRRKPAWTL